MSGSDRDRVRDGRGFYRPAVVAGLVLRFDRGTLLLEGGPPPAEVEPDFVYDPRVDAYRAPAHRYRELAVALRNRLQDNHAPRYGRTPLAPALAVEPYPHQREALAAWQAAGGRGLVALPTGAGKTLVGLLALAWAGRDALITVPTIDLMQQWYALLKAAFPDREIGLLGGGYHELCGLTVATYDSAARHIDRYGNRFGVLLCDEAHHLPSEFYRCIAEFSLAPYRLGLSATPERGDGRDADFPQLLGSVVYRREALELAGEVLAPFRVRTVPVALSAAERADYERAIERRNQFLREQRISLGSIRGWNLFVMRSARSRAGRQAMRAHQTARRIAFATPAKLRALAAILTSHGNEKTLIFTEDNATAYEIAQRFLIPCITHQTKIKERQLILERFRDGAYRCLVTSKVLNEGVDLPDASVGVILSGSGSSREFIQRLGRILRRAEDKRATLYEIIARDTREERVAERRREGSGGAAAGQKNLDL